MSEEPTDFEESTLLTQVLTENTAIDTALEAAIEVGTDDAIEVIEDTNAQPGPQANPPVSRWRRILPFAFFVGGFLFDALTLGRVVTTLNLVVVALYALGAGGLLVLLGRLAPVLVSPSIDEPALDPPTADQPTPPAESKWLRACRFGFNFCLGSLFSALVVVYFKSAGGWLTLLTVLLLFAGMVFNEFARLADSQRHLYWTIYCVSLVMLLNFVVPHVAGSIAARWFYMSTALGVGLTHALCWLAGHPFRMVRPATLASAGLVALFALGLIPPVPLVLKHGLVGREYVKAKGEYSCVVDQQSVWVQLGLKAPVVTWRRGERVDVLTAIFSPKGVEADMEHRWFHKRDGKWVQSDTVAFHIRGGRKGGWRMRSAKRNVAPGLWKVETAVAGGSTLGSQTFQVVAHTDGARPGTRRAL